MTSQPRRGLLRDGLAASLRVCLVAGILTLAGTARLLAADELPRLGVVLDRTSVSGLSAGAYMAGQFEIAHSADVIGAALVAGGPFGCAESWMSRLFPFWSTWVLTENAEQALHSCMKTDAGTPEIDDLLARMRELAAAGAIDPLSGLADDRVYLYRGPKDDKVDLAVVEAAAALLRRGGVPEAHVGMIIGPLGGHAFLTEDFGGACELTQSPFISDCDFDQAGAILTQILGNVQPKAAEATGRYRVFAQTPFAIGIGNGLAAEGVVYVPPTCAEQTGCAVHVVFHGCEQGRDEIGDAFVEHTGFARWADTNRLVLLFPQVAKGTYNPYGCWDWWGYSGLGYMTKSAPQIATVWAMLERLAEQPAAPAPSGPTQPGPNP